ncbi:MULTISPECIES: amidohydrolase family protein [Nitrosomonas]|uniref:Amidohydrolase n=1 Tax=Nitrosomonas communis TaxID=44574 RepID=A0A0F7K9X6_9PROT|nr:MULTISPECIES: amidohydrolase family protein [Nitrosomonas]AKH37105.1 amidohydrolase [Nitrosomonas communis]TYP94576.1 imidazolonepropionase-like amidohydrolase [Nitrosomonas communis]UVS62273.1 amidohydrolase family protein [Nitrosomonas sp. PLL12]
MKNKICSHKALNLMVAMIFLQGVSLGALAHDGENHAADSTTPEVPALPACQILTAARLFDGINFPQDNMSVLIEGEKIKQTGSAGQLNALCENRIDLGDATILPGFIESHAHITFQNVKKDDLLEHGITTVRDTGGPLKAPEGGQGTLRLLSVGPIIQTPDGYPLNVFGGTGGDDHIGISVGSVVEAEKVVADLVAGGATAIKIALEPGGESGAPWMQPHAGQPLPPTPWPLLPQEIVNAIVTKAHELGKKVLVHVGENIGFERALDANVDEFSHIPCSEIREDLLQRAVDQDVTFVTTIDTLASCIDSSTQKGIHSNTMSLASKGAKFIYGSEIGHDNVPWGINGEELHMMLHLTSGETIDFTDVMNVLKAATSKAGEYLGLAPLGTLVSGAPADIIAVRGNPFEKIKILEYPDLVISGGRTIVNKFNEQPTTAEIDCLFTWAEAKYPDLFVPAGASTEILSIYSYRFYSTSNAYLGVSSADSHVYYMGADGLLQNEGPISNWLPVSGCR